MLHLHPNRAKMSRTFQRSPGGISSDMLMYIQGWQGHHLGRGGKFLGRAVNTKRIFHIMNTKTFRILQPPTASLSYSSPSVPSLWRFFSLSFNSASRLASSYKQEAKVLFKHIHANDLVQTTYESSAHYHCQNYFLIATQHQCHKSELGYHKLSISVLIQNTHS